MKNPFFPVLFLNSSTLRPLRKLNAIVSWVENKGKAKIDKQKNQKRGGEGECKRKERKGKEIKCSKPRLTGKVKKNKQIIAEGKSNLNYQFVIGKGLAAGSCLGIFIDDTVSLQYRNTPGSDPIK